MISNDSRYACLASSPLPWACSTSPNTASVFHSRGGLPACHALSPLELLRGLVEAPYRHQALAQVQPGVVLALEIRRGLRHRPLQTLGVQVDRPFVVLQLAEDPAERQGDMCWQRGFGQSVV